jgi:hypothetical protein
VTRRVKLPSVFKPKSYLSITHKKNFRKTKRSSSGRERSRAYTEDWDMFVVLKTPAVVRRQTLGETA